MKITFAAVATVLAMTSMTSMTSAALASTNDGAPSATPGTYQCASYVRTARPGVNYTFPLGAEFMDLAEAKQDAYTRCATDAQARSWRMLCQVSCIQN